MIKKLIKIDRNKPDNRITKKYDIYDKFIKDYENIGNNISLQRMNEFLSISQSQITKQGFYFSKLNLIFKNAISFFKTHQEYYFSKQIFSNIFNPYLTLRIHRQQLIDILVKSKSKFQGMPTPNLLRFYIYMIEFHHETNQQLKLLLKSIINKRLTNDQVKIFTNKNKTFQCLIFNLKHLLMEKKIDLSTIIKNLNFIESFLIDFQSIINFQSKKIISCLSLIKELLNLQKIHPQTEIFLKILNKAIQSSYKIIQPRQKKQNNQYSFNQDKNSQSIFDTLKIINYGQTSIFETNFARYLEQFGYQYSKNDIIGMFEYDFLIKGRNKILYKPFQKIKKGKKFQKITQQEWQNFKNMTNPNYIKSNQKFQKSIVLNLHGPHHLIDSNVYKDQRVNRTDEIKGQILKNYGYSKYNTIFFNQWQQIQSKQFGIEDFISGILQESKI